MIAPRRSARCLPLVAGMLVSIVLVALACGRSVARVQIESIEPMPTSTITLPTATADDPSSATMTPARATSPQPARASLALMVGFTFPLEGVSSEQAAALLSGQAARWSDVGGPDLPVQRLTWEHDSVEAVKTLTAGEAVADPGGGDVLAADVAAQPGSLSLTVWDGPRLRSKALTVDGYAPDQAGYPLLSDRPRPPAEPGEFTLAAAGDLMLGRRVAQLAGSATEYPLALVASEFQSADLGFANLEVALTQRGDAAHKDYTFRGPGDLANGIRAAGIDVLSLANNHVFDFGALGLGDTLAALDGAGVAHAGAGMDAAAAAAPAIMSVRGTRIAFLSFVNVPDDSVSGYQNITSAAQAAKPGVNWGTPDAVTRAVQSARRQADVVIVTLHAGTEYADQPNETQRSLAHAAIDAGAALVIGAHPHVLQGVEYYHDGVILYSLGNFVFDLDDADVLHYGLAAAQTVVARITFAENRVRGLELLPAVIDTAQYRPVPAAGAAAQAVLGRIYRLTDELAGGAEAQPIEGAGATPAPAPTTPGR